MLPELIKGWYCQKKSRNSTDLRPMISVCNFTEQTWVLCFCCIHNTRPRVINCSMQICPHSQERTFTFFSITISSTGFACIVKWDWWKHPGHYSQRCLANFCALTSTKMSSRSSRLTLASPETINPLAGVVPAHLVHSAASKLLFPSLFPFYLFILVPSQLPSPAKSDYSGGAEQLFRQI